ncbi:hypothetical protein KP509_15G017700 [Ceratopteris richardii]|uniref:Uncharacterized protein n=1 Tax=Ceratopteris richardii TaxID=49495 RepID=A0A8T2T1D7_CERRI|nr:hypothetical protein KP509_15G017700 [Ceratopteris richardii]
MPSFPRKRTLWQRKARPQLIPCLPNKAMKQAMSLPLSGFRPLLQQCSGTHFAIKRQLQEHKCGTQRNRHFLSWAKDTFISQFSEGQPLDSNQSVPNPLCSLPPMQCFTLYHYHLPKDLQILPSFLAIRSRHTYCASTSIIPPAIRSRQRRKPYGFHLRHAAFFLGRGSIYQEQSSKKEVEIERQNTTAQICSRSCGPTIRSKIR